MSSNEAVIDLRDGTTIDLTNQKARQRLVGRTQTRNGAVLTLVEPAVGATITSQATNTVDLNRRRPALVTAPKPAYDKFKRAIDIVAGTAALLVAAPALIVGALAVRLTSPGPVFFSQERVGRNGEAFKILKVRSMFIDADHRQQRAFNEAELKGELGELDDFQLKTDPRITPIGAILRKTSVDELPQLLNVIKGEMSLVGPRPSCEWEVELYEPRFAQRHDVLPGITGLWQVEGRRTIDMVGMLELDVDYVKRRSTWLDLKILARTLPAVLSGTGAG